jgi:hypothetical protein
MTTLDPDDLHQLVAPLFSTDIVEPGAGTFVSAVDIDESGDCKLLPWWYVQLRTLAELNAAGRYCSTNCHW